MEDQKPVVVKKKRGRPKKAQTKAKTPPAALEPLSEATDGPVSAPIFPRDPSFISHPLSCKCEQCRPGTLGSGYEHDADRMFALTSQLAVAFAKSGPDRFLADIAGNAFRHATQIWNDVKRWEAEQNMPPTQKAILSNPAEELADEAGGLTFVG